MASVCTPSGLSLNNANTKTTRPLNQWPQRENVIMCSLHLTNISHTTGWYNQDSIRSNAVKSCSQFTDAGPLYDVFTIQSEKLTLFYSSVFCYHVTQINWYSRIRNAYAYNIIHQLFTSQANLGGCDVVYYTLWFSKYVTTLFVRSCL